MVGLAENGGEAVEEAKGLQPFKKSANDGKVRDGAVLPQTAGVREASLFKIKDRRGSGKETKERGVENKGQTEIPKELSQEEQLRTDEGRAKQD